MKISSTVLAFLPSVPNAKSLTEPNHVSPFVVVPNRLKPGDCANNPRLPGAGARSLTQLFDQLDSESALGDGLPDSLKADEAIAEQRSVSQALVGKGEHTALAHTHDAAPDKDHPVASPPRVPLALKQYFEQHRLVMHTASRMLAMAAVFPLFSISAQSAAKRLVRPLPALMNFQGAGAAMLIAGTDIATLLIANDAVKQGTAALSQQLKSLPDLVAALRSALTPGDRPMAPPRQKENTPEGDASEKAKRLSYAARVLLESFVSVVPCSVATTVMDNHFGQNPRLLQGVGRTLTNNLGFLTALEIAADKKPGDNRARIMTALLCAAASGANNGLAVGRALKNANVQAYILSNALAGLALQAVFEALRYPIHGKAYRQAAEHG